MEDRSYKWRNLYFCHSLNVNCEYLKLIFRLAVTWFVFLVEFWRGNTILHSSALTHTLSSGLFVVHYAIFRIMWQSHCEASRSLNCEILSIFFTGYFKFLLIFTSEINEIFPKFTKYQSRRQLEERKSCEPRESTSYKVVTFSCRISLFSKTSGGKWVGTNTTKISWTGKFLRIFGLFLTTIS